MVLAIVFIGIGIAVLLLLLFLIRCWLFGRHIVRNFKQCNVIVDGKKGTGKDLLFQYVTYKRKDFYYGNISYGGDCELIKLKEISIAPNTYEHFINDIVKQCKRRFCERKDIYISDGGVFLPSYADSTLHKTYKSMPLAYPLSRHLWEGNIHVNIQNFNRLWKPLREQADFWIHVCGKIKLPFFIFVKAITYDRQQSAENYLLPVKTRLFNKYSKAEADIYNATNGEIRAGWVIVRKSKIKYDTRAFEKIVYGESPRLYADEIRNQGMDVSSCPVPGGVDEPPDSKSASEAR